jgi:hypothetical protein
MAMKAGDYVLGAERIRAERAANHRSSMADVTLANGWEARARTKQLLSTRTGIRAGGELIDIENRWDALGVVDTVREFVHRADRFAYWRPPRSGSHRLRPRGL